MHAELIGNVPVQLVAIAPGEFTMGSGNRLYSEAPPRLVMIRSGFLLGRCPVTQEQWLAVTGENPSSFRNAPGLPVENVSWDQAAAFCRRLSERSGRSVRLPSEAEWEYACRAGTPGEFFFGVWGPCRDDSEIPSEAREALCDYAWHDRNSGGRTWPVGLKQPNPLGLHDMIGNVWEWCADVWHGDYTDGPSDGSPWMDGEDRQPRHCLRGGAWDMNAFRCRSTYRSYDHRDLSTNRIGFRLAVDA